MFTYRLYCLDSTDEIRSTDQITASGDAEAIAKAREQHRNVHKCEIWHFDRLVTTLNAKDLAG
jgi:hypothetical protein